MKQIHKIIILSLIVIPLLLISCYETEDVPESDVVEPSEFTQKLLLEDYTGTWCPNCPKAGHAIENAVAENDRFIPVAIHFYKNSEPEEMQNEFSERIVNEYHPLGGFPIVALNRTEDTWANDYLVSSLDLMLNRYAPVGLSINSTLVDDSISVTIGVGFVAETTTIDDYKLAVYLLESGMIYPQHDGGEIIDSFEHENVLRYSFTNVFGDDLPNQIATNHRYSKDYNNITLPASIEDSSKLTIVAFVLDKNGNCLNVQSANIGVNKDFD